MKKLVPFIFFIFSTGLLWAQEKEKADKLVDEGVVLHDKKDYTGAVAKYDLALQLDKDNLYALIEKAYTLHELQKYDEAVQYCKLAVAKHPGHKNLASLYVTYGNSLDGIKQPEKAIEIYDEGLALFPQTYMLHFNKAITLVNLNKIDAALLSAETAAFLKPSHASTQNIIARVQNYLKRDVLAILAYSRFLILEQKSTRALENFNSLIKSMNAGVETNADNSTTIKINSGGLGNKKEEANNFSTTELTLAMAAALDNDSKHKNKSVKENFVRKFDVLISSLKETKKDNYGFYWSYYAPYFIEMKDKGFAETFASIVFSVNKDANSVVWLKINPEKLDEFYKWSEAYNWQK